MHFADSASFRHSIHRAMWLEYQNDFAVKRLRQSFATAALRSWQSSLKERLDVEPDARTVEWIYDTAGNSGKSWMASYVRANYSAVVFNAGKRDDLIHIFSKAGKVKVCVFDLTRTMEGTSDSVVYQLAEQLKNGYMTSGKYQSCALNFMIPHVIIFANYEPDRSRLSADRWRVTNITPLGA